MIAQKYRPPVDFGLGGVAIGNEFAFVTDAQAEQVLEAAWEAGVRYFDTSPWYGLGLCERRFGRFLHDKPRGDYVLSTKVGKLLKASPANRAKTYFPFTTSPNDPVFDYSADGVRRSVEDSLQRMGLDRIDMLFVHDLSPDNDLLPEDWQTLFGIAAKGAFPALSRMRDEGMIGGWGMGVNCPQPILQCLEVADPDICLLASQYSLVDHEYALETVFPKAREAGISFVIGSSLNAGFLAGRPRYNYGKDNYLIPDDKLARRHRLQRIADRHGVDLRTAALQFSAAPDLAAALVVGASSAAQVLADVTAMKTKIPAAFWDALKAEGLIEQAAPVPQEELEPA
ncbi:MAG: L-fucose dehydrogenase [Alphaproteobacteria bacterium]|nr:L-fucose dehydrogenase [Alphaproteobacteria bacterium]